MGITYTKRSDIIDCKVNDKVYVYKKDIPVDGIIDIEMIGTVESIEQKKVDDWLADEYLFYHVTIKMNNGNIITIDDDYNKILFRKYEFITLNDLKKLYNIDVEILMAAC